MAAGYVQPCMPSSMQNWGFCSSSPQDLIYHLDGQHRAAAGLGVPVDLKEVMGQERGCWWGEKGRALMQCL